MFITNYLTFFKKIKQRLKSTWASLTTKWQKLYDEIEHLCLPNNNSKAMRDVLNEATTPLVHRFIFLF